MKIAKLPQHHSVSWGGLNLIIEWPSGSVREGRDEKGRLWRREQKADYGFVDETSTKGDKEPLDVYVGPNKISEKVYIIEQLKEDGSFDEFKTMLGFDGLEAAQNLYLAHYPKGWEDDRLGDVYETSLDDLKGAVEDHQDGSEESITSKESSMKSNLMKNRTDKDSAGSTGSSDTDKGGTKLTGFNHDGPATCMHCVHRTPHSQDEQGKQVDSCSHPLVMQDPELKDRKLPDGTIKVGYDEWCQFARAPQKDESEESDEVTKTALLHLWDQPGPWDRSTPKVKPVPPAPVTPVADVKAPVTPVADVSARPPAGLGFDMAASKTAGSIYLNSLGLMK